MSSSDNSTLTDLDHVELWLCMAADMLATVPGWQELAKQVRQLHETVQARNPSNLCECNGKLVSCWSSAGYGMPERLGCTCVCHAADAPGV